MNIRLLVILLALPLFVVSERGLAQVISGSFGNCSAMPPSVLVKPQIQITSPAGVGQPLGSWFDMGMVIIGCEVVNSSLRPQVGIDFNSGSRTEQDITVEGQQYTVLPTNNPDIGIIYKATIIYSNRQIVTVPYHVTTLSEWNLVGSMQSTGVDNGHMDTVVTPQARLIQLNKVIFNDYVTPDPLRVAIRRVDNLGTEPGMAPVTFSFELIEMDVAASCNVFIPTVTMPTLALGNFHGISDTPVTTQPFDIRLTDCTAGLSSLGYTITTNNTTNAARTIARVDASSQASGIGLGLLTRNGSPANIVFGEENPVTDFRPSSPAATVPLLAALYQMEANVTPGDYRGSFNFKLVYK